MKAIVHTQAGDASLLRLSDQEMPVPQAGEVRIRIMVSGVNPMDWKSRSGTFGAHVPNQDGAGIIDAVGPGIDQFAPGDRVWTVLAARERPAGGTAQEYTVVPGRARLPASPAGQLRPWGPASVSPR